MDSPLLDLCGDCGEDIKTHTLLTLTHIGNKLDYIVPSFPVFEAELRHMRYIFNDDDNGIVYDGFIHEVGALTASVNSALRLCNGHKNAFFIPLEEFCRGVDVVGFQLTAYGGELFVVWNWSVADMHDDNESAGDTCTVDNSVCSDQEQEEMVDDDRKSSNNTEEIHSVVFKCIGSTKEPRYQEVLAEAALKRRDEEVIEVRIQPEPLNAYDSRAIAVECFTGSHWERVGYLVREVLDSVHQTLQDSDIVSVELKWVKFITHWTRSCPGWYCGINITRKGGLWSNDVLRCRSTL